MERLGKIYDIICKLDFFNQRAARELWNSKPIEIQNQDIFNRHQDLCELKEFADDVAQLMKLQEQGLLPKLPCKVGNVVYEVDSCWACENKECKYVEPECEDCCDFEEVYFVKEKRFEIQMIELLGKTVFLTKEEAEEALRKKVDECQK